MIMIMDYDYVIDVVAGSKAYTGITRLDIVQYRPM